MRIMFLVFYASKLRKQKKKTLIEKEISALYMEEYLTDLSYPPDI